ncbi:DUF420 domain-containing protein [Myxococcota bacterium]|nr:DUF420 domain-containing protein [Myxococcota bacterium]
MDANLAYWTWALVNFGLLVGLAWKGVTRIRQRDLKGHRRYMLASASLVFLFVGSYALKLLFLGRENLAQWSTASLWVLRIHELCVLGMILGGAWAGYRAWKFRRSLPASGRLSDTPSPESARASHRRAGWFAVISASAAFVLAGFVLLGMYARQ